MMLLRLLLVKANIRIMYTRANLPIRLFSFTYSALIRRAALRTVENHWFSRSRGEGVSANPLNNKSLIKLHFVIFAKSSGCHTPRIGHSRNIVLNDRQ